MRRGDGSARPTPQSGCAGLPCASSTGGGLSSRQPGGRDTGDRHLLEGKLELQLRNDTSTLQITIERIQTSSPDSQRRLLLVGDQFEEIYTLCADASERKIFLDGLLQAVKNAPFFTLVLTLRADFFSKALDDYEPFGKALQDYQPELLVRMNREELERAIARESRRLQAYRTPRN